MNSPIRVLWVDDSRDVTEMLSRFIARETDMITVGALDAADQVLSEIERFRPNIVVMDLTMPGRDPISAISEMAAAHPDVRTIAYSGWDDSQTIQTVLAAGAWDIVSKSENPKHLLDTIRRVAAANEPYRKR